MQEVQFCQVLKVIVSTIVPVFYACIISAGTFIVNKVSQAYYSLIHSSQVFSLFFVLKSAIKLKSVCKVPQRVGS